MVDRNSRRAAMWELVQEVKSRQGCARCGFNKHPVALQFDHIRGDKKANISDLIRSDYGLATIIAEMAKCQVLCANCHAIVTHDRKRDQLAV